MFGSALAIFAAIRTPEFENFAKITIISTYVYIRLQDRQCAMCIQLVIPSLYVFYLINASNIFKHKKIL